MSFHFDRPFLVIVFLTLILIGFGFINAPQKGNLYGVSTLKGKVINVSFKRAVILDTSNHLWKVYIKRIKVFPGDFITVRGKVKGWKIYPFKVHIERGFLQKFRVKIHQLLKERFLESSRSRIDKKLGLALLFGENWFSYKERKKLGHLGIYHLIVISGFHYALFLGLLFIIPVIWNIRYSFALLFLSFFTLLILFPKAPAYRAFISISLFVLARLVEARYHPLKALIIAALISVIFYPYWVSNISFWLSYLAAGALILYYGANRSPEESFIKSFFGRTLGLEATLVVLAAITPLLVSFFHYFSYGSFLLTPLFTWIVEIYLLIGTLNLLSFWSISPLVDLQNWVANIFGKIFYGLPDTFYIPFNGIDLTIALPFTGVVFLILFLNLSRKIVYIVLILIGELLMFFLISNFHLKIGL